jgi:hypothetical protein
VVSPVILNFCTVLYICRPNLLLFLSHSVHFRFIRHTTVFKINPQVSLRNHIYRAGFCHFRYTDRGNWNQTLISNSQGSSRNYVISCPVRLHHTTSPKKVRPSRSVPGTEVCRLQHNSESSPDSEDLWFSPTAHDTCSSYRQPFRIVQCTVCRSCPSPGQQS